jgi:RNA polymerase sigma-70 factor (ECF subfamily)
VKLPPNKSDRLEWLYGHYGKRLCGYAIRVYKLSEDDAWDITYKALFRVNEKYEDYIFENEKSLNGFVFRVMINYLKNFFRDNKKQAIEVDLEDHHIEKQEISEKPSAMVIALEEELEKLEDWERMLLLMRSQEMSYAAIAAYVNKPEQQLKVYYQRLKKKITERMQNSEALKAK